MHTVKKGETVFSISNLYGITQKQLREANGITGNSIFEGQRLAIPGNELTKDIKTINPSIATRLVLPRFKHTEKHTLGMLDVRQAQRWDKESTIYSCRTLELPWRDNQPQISCIPCGIYVVVFEFSDKFNQNLWELKQVPNRSEVKFHPLTDVTQLDGCIGVGKEHVEFKPGVQGISYSGDTLKALHGVLHDQKYLTLEVVNVDSNFDYYNKIT